MHRIAGRSHALGLRPDLRGDQLGRSVTHPSGQMYSLTIATESTQGGYLRFQGCALLVCTCRRRLLRGEAKGRGGQKQKRAQAPPGKTRTPKGVRISPQNTPKSPGKSEASHCRGAPGTRIFEFCSTG